MIEYLSLCFWALLGCLLGFLVVFGFGLLTSYKARAGLVYLLKDARASFSGLLKRRT